MAWTSPLTSVLLGLGLAVTRWAPDTGLVLAVVVVAQVLVAIGWHRGVQAQAALTGAIAGLGLGLVVDAVVVSMQATTLEPSISVLGAGFLLVVVQQLARRDSHEGAVVSMAATASLAALTTLGAAWLVVVEVWLDEPVVWVAGAALVVASLLRVVPSDAWASWLALAAGTAAGWLAAASVNFGPGIDANRVGVLVGLACGVAVCVSDAFTRGSTHEFSSRWWMTGSVPVLMAAPLVYLAVRLAA